MLLPSARGSADRSGSQTRSDGHGPRTCSEGDGVTISIAEGQWRKISAEQASSEDIVIDHLDSGVGVMIYDTRSLETFAGHFPAPDAQHAELFLQMLDQSLMDFQGSAQVRIHVAGCSEQYHECWDEKPSETHRFVEEELKKRHRPNQTKDIRWPRSKVIHSRMTLSPQD